MSIDFSATNYYPNGLDLCSVLPKTDLAAMAAQQGVKPLEEADFLVSDIWPEDESIEEFLAYLRAKRREET